MITERVHSTSRLAARERTRQSVLAAARALFLHEDPDLVGIRGIATCAGVSVGTVMSFGGKDSLVVEVVDALIREIHAGRPNAAHRESPTDEVMALLSPFIDLFAAHQQLARSYAGILIRGKCGSEVFGALADQLIAEIGAVLTSHGVAPSDSIPGAEAIHLAYLGALFRWGSSDIEAGPMDITMLARAVQHICQGILR